jgi:hypothetical protein
MWVMKEREYLDWLGDFEGELKLSWGSTKSITLGTYIGHDDKL